jgi:hypothetical protein
MSMMLELRAAGFGWKEIGEILKTTACAARAEFSRETETREMKSAGVQQTVSGTRSRMRVTYQ